MSKHSLPGSLDLLLDTMCNTFGGVVFIALSLALAFFVCRSQIVAEENPEDLEETLAQVEKENAALEKNRDTLTEKLSSLRELAAASAPTNRGLAEKVAQLEQEKRNAERDAELLKAAQRESEAKIAARQKENQALREEIRQQSAQEQGTLRQNEEELRRLSLLLAELQDTLQRMPVKKLHFSRYERTSKTPYWVIVKNQTIYRLGTSNFSTKEVSVSRSGNALSLTPTSGIPLASFSLEELKRGFNPASEFLWVLLDPDSLESFVAFRRKMRAASIMVRWNITQDFVIRLVSHADYSASH